MVTDEPRMPGDCFDKYVRQMMAVNLNQFVQPTTFLRSPNQVRDGDSNVSLVFEPAEVLAIVPEELTIRSANAQTGGASGEIARAGAGCSSFPGKRDTPGTMANASKKILNSC
jgi:hypothetical protein